LRPLVYVYKCDACNQITSVEPERQEETIRRRAVSTQRAAAQVKMDRI
jgi:hypothetical protein